MSLAVTAFVITVAAIIGGYFAVTYLPGRLAVRALDRRLQEVSSDPFGGGPVASDATVVKLAQEGPLPALDRLMSAGRAGSLKRLIAQSGIRTTPSAVILFSIGLAMVCGLITMLVVRYAIAAPLVAGLAAFAPIGWLKHRRTARLKKFEELFPDALDLLSRAVRAGHAFQTALNMAADEVPSPVGPELRITFDQQNYGLPLRDALNELTERIAILDVRFFVTAVLIQRETGGNLAEILDNLAHVVRERFKIQRQIRVHTAHGRFTGYVLLGVPAFLAVALSFINPDHMGLLFQEHMGQVMLVGALVLQALGFVWIKQVIKIEV